MFKWFWTVFSLGAPAFLFENRSPNVLSEKLSVMVWTQPKSISKSSSKGTAETGNENVWPVLQHYCCKTSYSWMAMLRVWPLTNQTSLSWDKPKGCWRLRKDQKSVVTQLATTCFVKTGLNVGGEKRNIAFKPVSQQCCKTSCKSPDT